MPHPTPVSCPEEHPSRLRVHLEDIEHNRLPVIERKTGYSIPVIQAELTKLDAMKGKASAER
jgi:hypothetical protein